MLVSLKSPDESQRGDSIGRWLMWLAGLCMLYIVAPPAAASALSRTIEVPIDHDDPASERAALYYELGSAFDSSKPTVFIVADAQQFYVRKGSVAELQESLFGSDFNVVGIVGRGSTEAFVERTQGADGLTDWTAAWRIFQSRQWIEDIDWVRRDLLGPDGTVMLYGRSGGAFLVHQYLAVHGRHVSRAFTQAPLNPFIVRELGLNSDKFWEEITPAERQQIAKVLTDHPEKREDMIRTLQRQNFFHTVEELPTARHALISALAAGDEASYAKARRDYQVDSINELMNAPGGVAIRVRLFEFFEPSGARARLADAKIYPDLENQRYLAAPLLSLVDTGKIMHPSFDSASLHKLDTEVFVLAGRHDHTADFRSLISLAAHYPRHALFVADDNHTFQKLGAVGHVRALQTSFLRYGLHSSQLQSAMQSTTSLRWQE